MSGIRLCLSILLVAAVTLTPLAASCQHEAPAPAPTPTPSPTPTLAPTEEPMPSPTAERTLVVSTTADSGPGSLRQVLLDAQNGDNITFDSTVFPSESPAAIFVTSSLPPITQGNLTIEASDTGVILDGNNIPEEFISGLEISSDGNTIQGLRIVNFFPGAGISLVGGAQGNTIGGNRSTDSGTLGQGNLLGSNDIGIRLCDDGTSFNVIKGNLIGTDGQGNDIGINIEPGASRNVIGPDNVIAHNAQGIGIVGSNSLGNTITQNSIHDNEHGGILLWEGGNAELPAPLIFDFDLSGGTVAGTGCTNCIIEVFSDGGDEGEAYEGQTTTDDNGAFRFEKGTTFLGPGLTATATDQEGNTSGFSEPTSGARWSVVIQEGNDLPKTRLEPKQSRELEDNRIGDMISLHPQVQTEDPDDFAARINEKGLKWMRLSLDVFDWNQAEDEGLYSEHRVYPEQDAAIAGLANNHIKVMYSLVFWDEVIDETGGDYARFKTEEEIQRYLDYVQFIVSQFKGRIEYYEILNESNIGRGTQQYVEAADYINLVKRTVPVIQQEDPQAKIVVGAVTPFYCIEDVVRPEPEARQYLFDILESDVMPLVDGVSWHAMAGASPEYGDEYYYDYPDIVRDIQDTAAAHGFSGEYIPEELHWRTALSPHTHEYSGYAETAAAKYLARGIIINLGMTGAAGLAENLENLPKMSVITGLCTLMAGAEPVNLSVEIQSEATNIRSYGFSLPSSNKLIALWTDGVAVEDDAGVKATLNLPGLSARQVMGIDVLEGFEQPIAASAEDGKLVISNLLVKDYPVILRLMP